MLGKNISLILLACFVYYLFIICKKKQERQGHMTPLIFTFIQPTVRLGALPPSKHLFLWNFIASYFQVI